MARSLKLFGQASSLFSYQETRVMGRPVQLYDRCSNLRLGDISCGPPLILYWGSNSSFPITIHSLTRFQESRTRLRLKVQCQVVRGCSQFQQRSCTYRTFSLLFYRKLHQHFHCFVRVSKPNLALLEIVSLSANLFLFLKKCSFSCLQ